MISRLGARCEGITPEEYENILVTLKAIGNAGRPVRAENVLLKCALNLDAPVNMSIAALESLRRLPCNNEMAENLLSIYGNHDLDVEIRIAAYLAVIKCPSPEVFRRVADILKNEVNNQVGSFVWSHMTNAMESTEPVHGLPQAEIMKNALNGMKLREFNLNRLRFSRAWEGSFYSGKNRPITSPKNVCLRCRLVLNVCKKQNRAAPLKDRWFLTKQKDVSIFSFKGGPPFSA